MGGDPCEGNKGKEKPIQPALSEGSYKNQKGADQGGYAFDLKGKAKGKKPVGEGTAPEKKVTVQKNQGDKTPTKKKKMAVGRGGEPQGASTQKEQGGKKPTLGKYGVKKGGRERWFGSNRGRRGENKVK